MDISCMNYELYAYGIYLVHINANIKISTKKNDILLERNQTKQNKKRNK